MKASHSWILILVLALLAGTSRAETAKTYRGPVGELPKAVAAPGPDSPIGAERLVSRSRQVEGYDRWEFFFEGNREEWFRSALARRRAEAFGDGGLWAPNPTPAPVVSPEDVEERIRPFLLERLSVRDPEAYAVAAIAVGRAGAPEALAPLAERLLGPAGPERRFAALGLGLTGDKAALKPLVEFVGRQGVSAAERSYAVLAIGLLGDADAAPYVRAALSAALGRTGADAEEFQFAAVTALGMLSDRLATPLLTRIVAGGDGREGFVRAAAAIALSRIGDVAAAPVLGEALSDKDFEVRRAAAQALGRFGDPASKAKLVKAFAGDGDVGVRSLAAVSLARIGGEDVGSLLEGALGVRNPRALRGFAAIALGVLGDRQYVRPLRELLELKSEASLVAAAAMGLSLLGDPGSFPRLRAIVADESRDDDLRGYALLSLALQGDGLALPLVKDALRERGGPMLRRAAAQSLAFFPEAPAAPRLLAAILSESDPIVRGAAIESLETIARRDVVDPLLTVARSGGFGPDAGLDAIAALGVLASAGRPDPLVRFTAGANYRSLSRAGRVLMAIL